MLTLPTGMIFQYAYTVDNLDAAMAHYGRHLHLGPWFLSEHFPGKDMRYRGAASSLDISIAMAFSGTMLIELIQQNDDSPSVYRDVIARQGYGFHHWGIASRDFDADVAHYEALGHAKASSCVAATGDRAAYMDTLSEMPGLVEFIEIGPVTEQMFGDWYRASQGWEGRDPVRRVG